MKIDTHNHAIPEPLLQLLRETPSYGVVVESHRLILHGRAVIPLDRSFHVPSAKLAELTANGLEGAVISIAPPVFLYQGDPQASRELCRVANLGLAEFAAVDPFRMRWMAHVPMGVPDQVTEIAEEALSAGAVGIEVASATADRSLDDPAYDPLWDVAERRGVPVFIHPAGEVDYSGLNDFYLQNVIGNQFQTTVAVERLICAGVLDRFPRLRILLAHAGGYFPFQAGRLRHAAEVKAELADAPKDPWAYSRQIFVDTITHDTPALAYLVARMGVGNVVLGTDLPFSMATRLPLESLLAATDARTVEEVAENNPARLFSFSPTG